MLPLKPPLAFAIWSDFYRHPSVARFSGWRERFVVRHCSVVWLFASTRSGFLINAALVASILAWFFAHIHLVNVKIVENPFVQLPNGNLHLWRFSARNIVAR